jgi:hypothetical protein
LEASGRGLIEQIFRYLLGVTEEKHEKSQSGYPVSRSRFERRTSVVRMQKFTAKLTRSVINFRQQLMLLILANDTKGVIIHAVRTGVCVKLSQCYAKHRVMKMYGVEV